MKRRPVKTAFGNPRTQTRPSLSSVTPYSAGAQTMGAGDIVAPTWLVYTLSYCGPFEYRGGKLSRVNFPGGYISSDSACHYIRDHQGNVRKTVVVTCHNAVQIVSTIGYEPDVGSRHVATASQLGYILEPTYIR